MRTRRFAPALAALLALACLPDSDKLRAPELATTPPPSCPTSAPIACPAIDDAAASCWATDTACETVVSCNGRTYSCDRAGYLADCVAEDCVPNVCHPERGSNACQRCLRRKCCSRLAACVDDEGCTRMTGERWQAFLSCGLEFCQAACQ